MERQASNLKFWFVSFDVGWNTLKIGGSVPNPVEADCTQCEEDQRDGNVG